MTTIVEYDGTGHGWVNGKYGHWWHPSQEYPGKYVVSPNDHSPLQVAVVDDFGTLVIVHPY